LSSDDDDDDAHLPEHDALADQDVLAADDARGTGTTSAEATVPGLARAGLPGTIRPLPLIRSPPYHLRECAAKNACASP
jgi:hypothetical protein